MSATESSSLNLTSGEPLWMYFTRNRYESIRGIVPGIRKSLYEKIRKAGYTDRDERLNRTVRTLPGHFIVIKDRDVKTLAAIRPLDKYIADARRLNLILAISEARRDIKSRRIMSFNTADYWSDPQCFTSMQFIYTDRKEFDLYVYQRSADMVKLEDDLVFFANVGKLFSDKVGLPLTKIVVIYGSVHYETKKQSPAHDNTIQRPRAGEIPNTTGGNTDNAKSDTVVLRNKKGKPRAGTKTKPRSSVRRRR